MFPDPQDHQDLLAHLVNLEAMDNQEEREAQEHLDRMLSTAHARRVPVKCRAQAVRKEAPRVATNFARSRLPVFE